MKRLLLYTILCVVIVTTGCQSSINETVDSSKYAEPQYLYNEDPSIDMFVYKGAAFVNASDIDWVVELELTEAELFGTIKNTRVSKDFKDWDATLLDIGSEIYKAQRSDILLVDSNGLMIPYLKIVEG